ncbi:MAG TPA: translation initiation factor IF-2 associated domain-containing protein, partial [Burkholderiales bacterium]|nr:translation initiation factor IF-2 associated domain-containing protein [Burkholderiales bacterium]
MSEITVKGFAEQIGVPPETLLRQLGSAGIEEKQPDDVLSDEEKEQLFRYLRSSHGATDEGAARRKITLKRKSTTQVTQSSRTGATRTVQVEVRKKRTFVKRVEPGEPVADEAIAETPVAAPVPETAVVVEPTPDVATTPAPIVAPSPSAVPTEAKKPAPAPAKNRRRKNTARTSVPATKSAIARSCIWLMARSPNARPSSRRRN